MASKVYDFGNRGVVMSLDLGLELGTVSFKDGISIVHDEAKQEALEKWLKATSEGQYSIREYDPATEAAPVVHTIVGSNQANNLVQGIMTSMGTKPNAVVAELDSQLAQALVTGTVNELVAENPAVMEGAGFVENSAPSAPVAPAKPQLGAKK